MGNVQDTTSDDEDDESADAKWLSISLEKILNDSFVESLDLSSHSPPNLLPSADIFFEDDPNSEELPGSGNSTMLYLAKLHSASNNRTSLPKRVHDFKVSE